VEGAAVTFNLASGEGTPGYTRTDANGKYRLQTVYGAMGTTPGEYIVTIDKRMEIPTGKKVMEPYRDDETGEERRREVDEMTIENKLPVLYASVQSTPFKVTVEAKRLNIHDFTLE